MQYLVVENLNFAKSAVADMDLDGGVVELLRGRLAFSAKLTAEGQV